MRGSARGDLMGAASRSASWRAGERAARGKRDPERRRKEACSVEEEVRRLDEAERRQGMLCVDDRQSAFGRSLQVVRVHGRPFGKLPSASRLINLASVAASNCASSVCAVRLQARGCGFAPTRARARSIVRADCRLAYPRTLSRSKPPMTAVAEGGLLLRYEMSIGRNLLLLVVPPPPMEEGGCCARPKDGDEGVARFATSSSATVAGSGANPDFF